MTLSTELTDDEVGLLILALLDLPKHHTELADLPERVLTLTRKLGIAGRAAEASAAWIRAAQARGVQRGGGR